MSLLTETSPLQTSAAIDYIKLVHKSESDLICFGFLNSETKRFQQAFRTLEDALRPEFFEKLQNANQANSVYMSLNSFKSPERKTANVASIRSIGLDLDSDGGANLDKLFASTLIVEPSIVFETSPDKFQAIWTVENISVEDAERISKALAAEFGGDPAATDAARVMRLPGFRNLKYSEKPEVEVVHLAERAGRLSLDAFKLVLDKQPAAEAKPGIVSTVSGERARVPRGQHDKTLATRAGQLRNANVPLGQAISLLTQEVEDLYDDYGSDYEEMVKKCVKSIYKHPAGPDGPTVLKGGQLPGEAPIPAKGQSQVQEAVEVVPDSVLKNARTTNRSLAQYPIWAWEGTLYEDFANLCGEGNFIPKEYFLESIKTVVGAICGHRVQFADQNNQQPSRFYTILIGPGGCGKSTASKWAQHIFTGTGLLCELAQSIPFVNVGCAKGGFGSASGAIKNGFSKHPRILQTYDELTTVIEKFGITGSGGSFLDLNNEMFEYCPTMPNAVIKETKETSFPAREVHNSILGCTTPLRWQNAFKKTSSENSGFFQRLNVTANPSKKRVPKIMPPNFDALREQFVRQIQPLEYQRVVVSMDGEAEKLLGQWYAEKENEWENLPEDIKGRIQVLLMRNAAHLAWLMGGAAVVADPQKANEPIEVICDEDIMKRAMALAEYEVRVRQLHKPIEADNPYAQIENAIERYFIENEGQPVTQRELYRSLNANRHGTKIFDHCITNLVQEGILRLGVREGETKRGRKARIIIWVGDGD